jgi:site-specific DNA recombinase
VARISGIEVVRIFGTRSECGFGVTAEVQTNRFGSRYTYYHCTKKKPGYRCSQPYVSETGLEAQILSFLTRLRLPSVAAQWAAAKMQGEESARGMNVEAAKLSIDRALANSARERANLTTLRLRDQLDDSEFNDRREAFDRDKLRFTEQRAALDAQRSWIEPYEKLSLFSNRAAEWFCVGDARTKRLILQVVGSNPTLKDKKVLIEANEPFREWSWPARVSEWCSTLNDVRTLTATNNTEFAQTIASVDEIIARMAVLDERAKAA